MASSVLPSNWRSERAVRHPCEGGRKRRGACCGGSSEPSCGRPPTVSLIRREEGSELQARLRSIGAAMYDARDDQMSDDDDLESTLNDDAAPPQQWVGDAVAL